eukprot:3433632-Rhodomonas_salina.1
MLQRAWLRPKATISNRSAFQPSFTPVASKTCLTERLTWRSGQRAHGCGWVLRSSAAFSYSTRAWRKLLTGTSFRTSR